MIDHVSVAVKNLQASAAFYERVLATLGFARLIDRKSAIGFGKKYPEFWLNVRPNMSAVQEDTGIHICLRAPSKKAVTEFYNTALFLGGRSDGEPRDRQGAITSYFGAFIRDLDGNKIEAVFFPSRTPK